MRTAQLLPARGAEVSQPGWTGGVLYTLCSHLPLIMLKAALGREEDGEQVGPMRTVRSGEVE